MTELVHVPRTSTVYDTSTRLHRALRFVWRQWSRLRAGLAGQMAAEPQLRREAARLLRRYRYEGRHSFTTSQPAQRPVRTRDAAGHITEEIRMEIPAQPTLRSRIRDVRAARRNSVPAIKHRTGAFPAVSKDGEDTWSWLTADEWSREQQRKINNAQLLMTGAEGPLTS